MAKWLLIRKSGDYTELGQEFKINPLLARVVRNRGVSTKEEMRLYFYGDRNDFHDSFQMKDMENACLLLKKKLEENKRIRIIGDYDIDGVCATAILMRGFQALEAEIDSVIPHRMKDGYGMNKDMILAAYEEGIDTIVTCDNGISAKDAVGLAKEKGMTVVITDHHEVPYTETEGEKCYVIPPADYVVDPKQEDCGYPFPHICGAFVAFKLVYGLCCVCEKRQVWEALEEELLQMAAFATVGDIMELKGENRALVKEGLALMSKKPSVGIGALLSVLGLQNTKVSAFHLGFLLGPCLNATGRIDSADRALELLLTKDKVEAMKLAGDLKAMNDSRKMLTEKGTAQAIREIEEKEYDKDKVLVVFLPDCHESVAGIIAGRIREKYGKPTFIVTKAEEGLKGSGRSIEAYEMYEEMCKVKEVFTKFGGHSQAAGFSLLEENLPVMRQKLNENCKLTKEEMQNKLYLDAEVPLSYITGELVNQIQRLEPFGNGNEKPMFARKDLRLMSGKLLGNEGKVGKYKVLEQNGQGFELTLFQRNDAFRVFLQEKYGEEEMQAVFAGRGSGVTVNIAYYPQWNEYQGRKSLQYVMVDFC